MKTINNDIIHEQLFKNRPLLAYDAKNEYAEWKEKVKEKYIELLGLDSIAQNACDIQVEIEERVKTDEYTRYRYVFESEKGCLAICCFRFRSLKEKLLFKLQIRLFEFFGMVLYLRNI